MYNWKYFCSALVDAVDSSQIGKPKYLLSSDEALDIDKALIIGGVAGWTSRVLDLQIAESLVQRGAWQGRGFAAVVDVGQHSTLAEIGGTCLHELCHWFDVGGKHGPVSDVIERSRALRRMDALAETSVSRSAVDSNPLPTWHGHGQRFVRAACHAAYRAGKVSAQIDAKLMRFATGYYQNATERQFMQTLLSELVRRSDEPIAQILKSPAPSEFVAFWHKATGTKPVARQPQRLNLNFRRVQRMAVVSRGGVMAVLVDPDRPRTGEDGKPEYLLASGFETRFGNHAVPIVDVDGEGGSGSVRNIIGSLRNLTVDRSRLVGRAVFASDDQAQETKRQFLDGKRKVFKLVSNDIEGVLLKDGEQFEGIAGPATVITKWRPHALETSQGYEQ